MKPIRFFGLHMVEGVAEYRDAGKDPYRIFLNENTIKAMDASFDGLPVYVHHVDEVNLDNFKAEADGVVVKSFYNKADGKHWCEFIVFTDRAVEAIKMKHWKLSNAYIPKEMGSGGVWHGVDYQREVKIGEYEHLAIVPDPRYAESIILTPEEFKIYNNDKEIELTRLANSKGENKMAFSFFKKSKVENAIDESMSVILPKSKVEKTLTQIINETDERLANGYSCNGDESVKVGEHKMTVNELVEKHLDLQAKHDALSKGEDEGVKEKALEIAAHEDKEMKSNEDPIELKKEEKHNEEVKPEEVKANEEEKPEEVKKENEEEKPEEKKKNHYEAMKNAHITVKKPVVISLASDKVATGKSRYGSN